MARLFADDLVVVCHSKTQLNKAWKIIHDWSIENEIKVNKDKSAVMVVRVEKRTPATMLESYQGIKYTSTFKYLGVQLSDDLNMQEHLASTRQQELNLNKIKWILKSQNRDLDGVSKYHLF